MPKSVLQFAKASKYQSHLRMGISGPPGSGKTYTSLVLATVLAGERRVALIDTEHGSAAKCADGFDFDMLQLDTFSPQQYMEAIAEAVKAGYGTLVIDSLSHAWAGRGGLLEEKDRIATARYGGNSFRAWADAGALQNQLIDAILSAPLHVICTLRSKTEYVLEKDDRTGKTSPRKLGMAPVQRDDVPYEFDIYGRMGTGYALTIEKSRCSAVPAESIWVKPDDALADLLLPWLSGSEAPTLPKKATSDHIEQAARLLQLVAMHDKKNMEDARAECLAALALEGRVSEQTDEDVLRVIEWANASGKV